MKKTLKILCVFIFLLLVLTIHSNVKAATVTLSAPTEVKVGETITVKANINAAQWNLSISCNGTVLASSNELVNAESNLSRSFQATYTPTKEGTVTFVLSGDYTDIDTTNKEISTEKKVTVKAKEVTPAPEPKPEPKPDPEPKPPVVTEPKFTSADKTMYATGDINLRASWSTSSNATRITKGTELKVTGTSTDKVNGYVWYKVSYNGATKYVASNLLTSTKPEEEKKSDNANLKSLTIENQELLPIFSKDVTSYSVQVANNINELKVNAVAEDEKASVSINGNKDLKVGENTLTISVSAEDGTNKIYEIKVTRLEEEAFGLKSLSIEGTEIANTFKTEVYDYEISIKDISKLEIEAIATVENASVEILGNEDLQEGENFITIIVKSEDGAKTITYQIKVTKTVAGTVTAPTAEENKTIDPKVYVYIGIGAILLIALIIVIIYTIKHRNQEDYDYIDNLSGFSGDLPEKKEINTTTPISPIKENEPEKQEKRQAKIDYFLDEDEEEKPRRKKGKHF